MKKYFDAILDFSSKIPSQAVDLIQEAFDYARSLESEVQRLRDEIARLKQVPEKPEIKKGKDNDKDDEPKAGGGKRGGSRKERRRQKKTAIEIHETKVIKPQGLPPGAKLLDVQEYTVQDIEINGSHIGMGWNPAVLRVVADRLAQRPGGWQPYRPDSVPGNTTTF